MSLIGKYHHDLIACNAGLVTAMIVMGKGTRAWRSANPPSRNIDARITTAAAGSGLGSIPASDGSAASSRGS